MSETVPSLPAETLQVLRRLIGRIQERDGRALPMADLAALATAGQAGVGLTIDFGAARDLGHPLVVLRLPSDNGGDGTRSVGSESAAIRARLSPRQCEVAGLIAEGLSNKQIAARLHISLGTVKDHVHHILSATGLPNRTAVALALGSAAAD